VTAQSRCELQPVEKATEQLETAERSEAVTREAQGEIAVDTSVQVGFSSSHWWCPPGAVEKELRHSLQTTPKSPPSSTKAALHLGVPLFAQPLLSR
jgi:hypothetical protein